MRPRDRPAGERRAPPAIPAGVWMLGVVSLLMDVSSEIIHSLLPVYLVAVLGVGILEVGLIEGIALATVAITKAFSGTLSDYWGKRKPLALVGYGIAAATKPIFPLATGVGWILFARFVDRFGKGIRGAPRDALVADLTPPEHWGAGYGIRQSLDTVGAFAGPVVAVLLMAATAGEFRTVFWIAVVPAVASVAVLALFVHEPPAAGPTEETRLAIRRAELGRLGRSYWWFVAVAVGLMTARYSDAFLLLRADSLGLAPAFIPVVLVAMNLAFALSSYPAGRLSDRIGRRGLVLSGFAALVVANLVLAGAGAISEVFAGVLLWGLHLGTTQGLLAAMVVDVSPARLRGSAFGMFHLATGFAMLAGSLAAGLLWDLYGPRATFLAGGGIAALATLAFLFYRPRERPGGRA